MAFKMKRSPVKGKLSDFFSSLGKQLQSGQKDRGIFSEKGKAEKKEMRKTGESKYQFDVRKRKEKNKAKKADKPRTDILTKNIKDTSQKGDEAVRPKKATVANEPKSKLSSAQEMINMAYKGTNNDWDKASKNAMDMYGTTLTELIGKRKSPAEKKSPSKKRGYKIKRKK